MNHQNPISTTPKEGRRMKPVLTVLVCLACNTLYAKPSSATPCPSELPTLGTMVQQTHTEAAKARTQLDEAEQLHQLGRDCMAFDDKHVAEQAFEKEVAILETLLQTEPSNQHYRRKMSDALSGFAQIVSAIRGMEDADGLYARLVELNEQLAEDTQNPHDQSQLADAYFVWGMAHKLRNDRTKAIELFQSAVDILQLLTEQLPNIRQYQSQLAATYNHLGETKTETGDTEDAKFLLDQAYAIRAQLAAQYPDPNYQYELAETLGAIGLLQHRLGDHSAMTASFEQAIDIESKIVERFPGTFEYVARLVLLTLNHSDSLQDNGDLQGATKALKLATCGVEQILQLKPSAKATAADIWGSLAWHQLLLGSAAEALDSSKRALELAPSTLWIVMNQAHALLLSGQRDAAMAIYREHKDQTMSTHNDIRFGDQVLLDFEELKQAGAIDSKLLEVEQSMKSDAPE